MDLEDRLLVETAEGVRIEFSLAGIASRILAATVDGLIQIALIIAVAVIAGELFSVDAPWSGATPDDREVLIWLAFVQASAFVVFFFYYVFFEMVWSGRTPGKRATGLRTVQSGGGPVGLKPSLIRNILRLADVLPVVYAAGLVSIAVTKRNQRLGDLVAGTVVVRERKPETPAESSEFAKPVTIDSGLTNWDVSAVTELEMSTVRQFLARRAGISLTARNQLAADIAQRLRPKVRGGETEQSDETFLEKLASIKTARG
ncbi:MAG: RDD family protein [Actinomycetota bacterium]|nr:RDD family protein [Actinomycetota bacterium]